MGINISFHCCYTCKTNTATQEDEGENDSYLDEHQLLQDQIRLSFRTNYYKLTPILNIGTFFDFSSTKKLDFINEENRILQCSAIMNITEIPEIPETIEYI